MKTLWFIALLLAVSSGVIAIQPTHIWTPQHVLRDGNGGPCPTAKVCKP
jgi:hypothetical protein